MDMEKKLLGSLSWLFVLAAVLLLGGCVAVPADYYGPPYYAQPGYAAPAYGVYSPPVVLDFGIGFSQGHRHFAPGHRHFSHGHRHFGGRGDGHRRDGRRWRR